MTSSDLKKKDPQSRHINWCIINLRLLSRGKKTDTINQLPFPIPNHISPEIKFCLVCAGVDNCAMRNIPPDIVNCWMLLKAGTGNREPGTGNREPGTGNGERESGNECTAVFRITIQNGGCRKRRTRTISVQVFVGEGLLRDADIINLVC